jgi:methionine-S-sulfoxide reductase
MVSEIILAAGCFWSVQYKFDKLKGVIETKAVYTGGFTENPTYQEVCKDNTGHTEAVYVKYDTSIITTNELLNFYFQIHDPTQLNRQGPDVGSQYRSAIFYYNDEQKKIAEKIIEKLQNSDAYKNSKIVTEVQPITKYYIAEEYHQKYYKKRGF